MIHAILNIKSFDIFIDIFSTAIIPEAFNVPSSLPFPHSDKIFNGFLRILIAI
jgi:hypothetical protein